MSVEPQDSPVPDDDMDYGESPLLGPTSAKRQRSVAGLLTLHEPGLISAPFGCFLAALASDGEGEELQPVQVPINLNKNYYGAKTGDLLPHDKVLAGRQKELDNI